MEGSSAKLSYIFHSFQDDIEKLELGSKVFLKFRQARGIRHSYFCFILENSGTLYHEKFKVAKIHDFRKKINFRSSVRSFFLL